ncbi:hypothetical protein Vi05172_g4781 [Venturia inaequalis]|nr:hypothetical protein Vi05172_g4781 [Venturia inaequalis]
MASSKTNSRSCRIFTLITSLLIVLAIVIPIIVHFAKNNAHQKAMASHCRIEREDDDNHVFYFNQCDWTIENPSNAVMPDGLFDDIDPKVFAL